MLENEGLVFGKNKFSVNLNLASYLDRTAATGAVSERISFVANQMSLR